MIDGLKSGDWLAVGKPEEWQERLALLRLMQLISNMLKILKKSWAEISAQ